MAVTNPSSKEELFSSQYGQAILSNLIDNAAKKALEEYGDSVKVEQVRFTINFDIDYYHTVVQLHVQLSNLKMFTVFYYYE